MTELKGEKKLMYDLIFGEKNEYDIPIMEYIPLIDIDVFTSRVILNLELAGLEIIDDILILTKDRKSWILKIKR